MSLALQVLFLSASADEYDVLRGLAGLKWRLGWPRPPQVVWYVSFHRYQFSPIDKAS
jgi:hypothetical protein